jgi:hypothetical protein
MPARPPPWPRRTSAVLACTLPAARSVSVCLCICGCADPRTGDVHDVPARMDVSEQGRIAQLAVRVWYLQHRVRHRSLCLVLFIGLMRDRAEALLPAPHAQLARTARVPIRRSLSPAPPVPMRPAARTTAPCVRPATRARQPRWPPRQRARPARTRPVASRAAHRAPRASTAPTCAKPPSSPVRPARTPLAGLPPVRTAPPARSASRPSAFSHGGWWSDTSD